MSFRFLLKLFTAATILFGAISIIGCSEEDPVEQTQQYLDRAVAYQEQGQFKASIIEFRNAVKKSPEPDEALFKYAKLLNEMGRNKAALDVLKQIKNTNDVNVLLESVKSHIAIGKYRSAETILKSPELTLDGADLDRVKLYKGKVFAGQGNMEDAKATYTNLLNSQNLYVASEARVALAKVQASQKQFLEALSNVDKVPSSEDQYIEAQVIKASILIVREELEKAESVLTDALAALPNTDIMLPQKAVVLERLSYVLTRLGRSNEAYIYQRLLADAFPGANDLNEQYQQALTSFQNKDYLKASATLEGILNDYPLYEKAKQLLGIIRYLKGNVNEASTLLSDSVDPEIADPVTRHIYAATNLKLNDPKKVIEILEPELETTDAPETLVLYALAVIADGRLADGEKALERAVELAPKDPKIRIVFANYFRRIGELEQELVQLKQARNLDPDEKQALAGLVSYYLRNDGNDTAERFLQESLRLYPNSYATHLITGYFYAATEQIDRSIGFFETALKQQTSESDRTEVYMALGQAKLMLGKFAEAETRFLDVVKLNPENENAYRGLLAIYRNTSEEDDSESRIEAFANRNAVVQPYFVLIRDSLAQGEFDAATNYLGKAKSMNLLPAKVLELEQMLKFATALGALEENRYGEARNTIASLLSEMSGNIRLLALLTDLELRDGNVQEARKVLGQIEVLNQSHPVIPILKADINLASGDLSNSRVVLENAWKSEPNEIVADKLFNLLTRLDDLKARTQHLEEWSRLFPNSPTPMLLKAMSFQQRGQSLKATELYEKLLSLAPNEVAALNNLGWIYFEKGDERSITLLRRAAKLAPNNADVIDSLGWVLFKRGEVEEGRALLEQATKLAPDNGQIRAHFEEASKG